MSNAFAQAETFEPIAGLTKTTQRAGLVLLVPLAVITWVIVTLILGGLGLPVAWLFGIVISLAFIVVIYRARGRKLDAMTSGMSLTVDSRGITERNPIATRFVSWEGLREARMVKPIVGMSAGKLYRGGRPSETPGVDALGSAAASKEFGLVGVGTVELSADANAMDRETYRQNEGRNGVDALTGQPLVALYFTQFDPKWPDARIGEWVDRFRPDVFATAKATYDEQSRLDSLSIRELAKDAWDKPKAQVAAERAEAERKATEEGAT